MRALVVWMACALLQNGQALAGEPTPDEAAVKAKAVSELVVTPQPKCLPAQNSPAPTPKIVGTFPSEGQVVRPGLLIIRITFDRPMTCGGFLQDLSGFANPCPPQTQTFIQSFDHKTIRTLCLTHPGQAYGVVVGAPSEAFVSLYGQKAEPLPLRFRTSGGPAETSVQGALAADPRGRSSAPEIRAPRKRHVDPSLTTSAPGIGPDLMGIRPEQP